VRTHERVVADLEHTALEQRVDHLEQVERIAADARHELRADLPDAVADGEARLDEADLLLARQRMELDADLALEQRRHAIIGRVTRTSSTGSGSGVLRSSATRSSVGLSAHWRPSITRTSG